MANQSLKMLLRPMFRGLWKLRWQLRGSPPGHSFFKQQRLREIGKAFACSTLVETGTNWGDTVATSRHDFKRVLSVELSPELFQYNQKRFRKASNVFLWHGDSSAVMPLMLEKVLGRALFWLDGHYSGPGTALGKLECPLMAELTAIYRCGRRDHCILIDDARDFGVVKDYPTIQHTEAMLRNINPNYNITVKDGLIMAVPYVSIDVAPETRLV